MGGAARFEQTVARPLKTLGEDLRLLAWKLAKPSPFGLQLLHFLDRSPPPGCLVDPGSHEVARERVAPLCGEDLYRRHLGVYRDLALGKRLNALTDRFESLQMTGRVELRTPKPVWIRLDHASNRLSEARGERAPENLRNIRCLTPTLLDVSHNLSKMLGGTARAVARRQQRRELVTQRRRK